MNSNGVMAGLAGLSTLAIMSFNTVHGAKAEGQVQILSIPEAGVPLLGSATPEARVDGPEASGPGAWPRVPLHHRSDFQPGSGIVQGLDGVWTVPLTELLLEIFDPVTTDPDAEADTSVDASDIFPEAIRALDGQRVTMKGFVEPMEYAEGSDRLVTFAISRFNDGCGFGGGVGFDEWVRVDAAPGESFEFIPFTPVVVTGTFEVGEELDEFGYLLSIYRIRADAVKLPW